MTFERWADLNSIIYLFSKDLKLFSKKKISVLKTQQNVFHISYTLRVAPVRIRGMNKS